MNWPAAILNSFLCKLSLMIYINPIGEAERNCMGMSGVSLLFMDKSV
jgi:hypothetical protein